MFGVTTDYIRRVANGTRRPPRVIVVDPRDYIPELHTIMDDEDVVRWQANPICLCGCGEPTRQSGGKDRGKTPLGSYQPFRGNHEKRMPWFLERMQEWNTNVTRRRKIATTQRSHTVDSTVLRGMITEYCQQHQITLVQMAERANFSASHLQDIMSKRNPRVQMATVGRFMIVMGEPMRPEIQRAYREWAASNQ